MLWYKSWLETRWRFLIGLLLVCCSAAATVFTYPEAVRLISHVSRDVAGPLGDRIRESAALAANYRGYIWSEWFRRNLAELITLFAILLGTGSLFTRSGGALFTLSLPVSRTRLLGVRAAAGLTELFLLVLVPSTLISLLAPAIRESYGIGSALVHGAVVFVVATVFFMLALLLSTAFSDPWRPLLIAIAVALVLMFIHRGTSSPYSLFRVMSAESYFRSGQVPWIGLLVSAVLSAALFGGAVVNLRRRDF